MTTAMFKRFAIVILLLGVGVALFAACGSSSSSSSSSSADDDAAPADDDSSGCGSPDLITGTWKSALVTLTVAADGSYTAVGADPGVYDVKGQATVSGCTVSLTDLSGVNPCPSNQVGQYTYNVTSTTLKFTLVKDACQGRSVINGVTFTRQ